MTKVAPSPRTSGIIAAWLMRTKLEKVRKFGLMAATMTHSATSTISGAQGARRKRRTWPCLAARPCSRRAGAASPPAVIATAPVPAQPYWICPVARPQMSLQSIWGSLLMLLS